MLQFRVPAYFLSKELVAIEELDLAVLFALSYSLQYTLIRLFNLEVIAEDVSHQRSVVQEFGVLLTEVSSEVVVWSPEVEGLREAAEQGFGDDMV